MRRSGTWKEIPEMSKQLKSRLVLAGAIVATLGLTAPVAAQGVYAYPKGGQSAQQQQKDEAECNNWAVQRTGFDPSRQRTYVAQGGYSSPPPRGNSGLFGRGDYGSGGGVADAGKGAAVGALGGAIAGNAGKGAAIGALSGLFIGGVKRSNQQSERDAWERQQAQQRAAQQNQIARQEEARYNEYIRAYSACLQGRNYQIQ